MRITPRHRRAAVIVTGGLLVLSLVLLAGLRSGRPPAREVALSDFLKAADSGALRQVEIEPDRFVGAKADGSRVQTAAPLGYAAAHQTFVPDLIARGIRVEVKAGSAGAMFSASALMVTLAFFGLLGFALYRLNPGRLPSVEQDARQAIKDGTSITFADVAGVDEAKDELKEIVEFLRDPGRFGAIGGRIPKGVLLVGPPGTGKTLLARSIAGEAGVPFLFASGSDFVEMFAGVGASRVRKLFKEARKHPASIIFIDELDAVGRSRGSQSLSHEEREQTLNQLLVEMDGFAPNQGIVVIAATNRPDILDKALDAAGPVRPAGDRRQPRPARARGHPGDSLPQGANQSRREPARGGARHARVFRRGPGQPGERSRAAGRARRPPVHRRQRSGSGPRQGADGRGAPIAGHDRRRAQDHRLSRSGTRRGGGRCCRTRTRFTRSPSFRVAARLA